MALVILMDMPYFFHTMIRFCLLYTSYVIPFQIDRQKAEEIFSQWIGRKKYVPETFYNNKQIESMSGVYFPYWLYSCRVDGELDAQGTRLRT